MDPAAEIFNYQCQIGVFNFVLFKFLLKSLLNKMFVTSYVSMMLCKKCITALTVVLFMLWSMLCFLKILQLLLKNHFVDQIRYRES
jgi:hypothetical protein